MDDDIGGDLAHALGRADDFLEAGELALGALGGAFVAFGQLLGQRVEFGAVFVRQVELQLGEPGGVMQRYCGAVGDRLGHVVSVDHVAKDGTGVAVAKRDRGSGEADEGCVGQGLAHIFGEACRFPHRVLARDEALFEAVLRAVRLVGDDDHVRAVRQQRMLALFAAKLLDRRKDEAADVDVEQLAHLGGAVGLPRRHAQGGAMRDEFAEELIVEIVSVGQHDDRRVLERADKLQLAHEEYHGQRLAGALRVPDDSAFARPPAPAAATVEGSALRTAWNW